LVDFVSQAQILAITLAPLALELGKRRARYVAFFNSRRGNFAGHDPRVNRPADAFTQERGCLPDCVTDAQDSMARESERKTLGWNQSRVMLQRLSPAQIHFITAGTADQSLQIRIRFGGRIRMNDADANAHPVSAPRKHPG